MYIFTMLYSQLTLSLIPPSHTAEYVLCAWSVLWALYSHFHYHNPIQCMECVNHTLFPSTAELMNICFTNAKWNRVSLLFAIHYNVYNPTDNAPKAFHIVAKQPQETSPHCINSDGQSLFRLEFQKQERQCYTSLLITLLRRLLRFQLVSSC